VETTNFKWYQVVKKVKLWWWKRQNAVITELIHDDADTHEPETCYACGNFNEDRLVYDSLRIRCLDCGYYWDDPIWAEAPGVA